MKSQRIILVFVIMLIMYQLVSSKSCETNADCSSKQCCVRKDGAMKCESLAKKGGMCSEEGSPVYVQNCPCKSGLTCAEENGELTCVKM